MSRNPIFDGYPPAFDTAPHDWMMARVGRPAHDGDSVEAWVAFMPRSEPWLPLRLWGIGAEEVNSSDPIKRAAAIAARDRLRELVPPGAFVMLDVRGWEKYGRLLAVIYTWTDGLWFNVNAALVSEGHAKHYMTQIEPEGRVGGVTVTVGGA